MKFFHQSVMVKEVLYWLNLEEGDVYVDCTIGLGGHSKTILKEKKGKVRILGIDWDEEALRVAKEEVKEYEQQVTLIKANFKHLPQVLKKENINKVDGILYDLGLSSIQLDNPKRGFSFRQCGPLDMRMDGSQSLTATHLVNQLSEKELECIFLGLGEEKWARRVAKFIVEERKLNPLKTTRDLVQVAKRAIPAKFRRGKRIHFATRIFQALRIKVNEELENLEISLNSSLDLLRAKGRICVISYHSLEDRIVKRQFRKGKEKGLKILTKKVIRPSVEEIRANPRARSAKLRAAEKM